MAIRWQVLATDETEVHVRPVAVPPAELPREHETSAHCWCKPVVEQHRRLLVIHNAFDN